MTGAVDRDGAIEAILRLGHSEWWQMVSITKVVLRGPWESIEQDIEKARNVLPLELGAHFHLACHLDGLSEAGGIALWKEFLGVPAPWLDALLQKHERPADPDAFAPGRYRLSAAVAYTHLAMRSPTTRQSMFVLHAGIHEPDASDNQDLVQAAIRRLGLLEVLTELERVWQHADTALRQGILTALYWCRYDPEGLAGPPRGEDESRIEARRQRLGERVEDASLESDASVAQERVPPLVRPSLTWLEAW